MVGYGRGFPEAEVALDEFGGGVGEDIGGVDAVFAVLQGFGIGEVFAAPAEAALEVLVFQLGEDEAAGFVGAGSHLGSGPATQPSGKCTFLS